MAAYCSTNAYHDCWEAFHKSPFDDVYVPRQSLAEVLECHERISPGYRQNALIVKTPHTQAKKVLVRRAELFLLLKGHGSICGFKIRD